MKYEKEIEKIISEKYINDNCLIKESKINEQIICYEQKFLENLPYDLIDDYSCIKKSLITFFQNEVEQKFKLGLQKGIKITFEILIDKN